MVCVYVDALKVAPLETVKALRMVMLPEAVLAPVLLITKLSYVRAFTFCEEEPLNVTVLGVEVVTSSVPAVMVNAPAIPKLALVASRSCVPLIVTLNKLAVPFKADVPVKVVVPEVAV